MLANFVKAYSADLVPTMGMVKFDYLGPARGRIIASERLSECPKFHNFPGGACPQLLGTALFARFITLKLAYISTQKLIAPDLSFVSTVTRLAEDNATSQLIS